MNKYVVTVNLGVDYYEATMVRCEDIFSAISCACDQLNCASDDIVNVAVVRRCD